MSPTKPSKPNEKDALFMLSVLENMEGKPKVDWEAVAAAMGLKSGGVASVRFGQIKRKLGWNSDNAAATTTGSQSTSGLTPSNKVTKRKAPVSGSPRGKRARKAPVGDEKEAQDDEEGSGDADSKDDISGIIKLENDGQGNTDLLAALKAEMNEEDEARFNEESEE